jgi:hypothetical protein
MRQLPHYFPQDPIEHLQDFVCLQDFFAGFFLTVFFLATVFFFFLAGIFSSEV